MKTLCEEANINPEYMLGQLGEARMVQQRCNCCAGDSKHAREVIVTLTSVVPVTPNSNVERPGGVIGILYIYFYSHYVYYESTRVASFLDPGTQVWVEASCCVQDVSPRLVAPTAASTRHFFDVEISVRGANQISLSLSVRINQP